MTGDENKKKLAVAGLTTILLVAAVIAVAVGNSKNGDIFAIGGDDTVIDDGGGSGVTATTKAVEAICAPTSYKETCEMSLADANTTDTRQLVETAINVTVATVADVLKNSSLLREAATDPATKEAFKVCDAVLERAAVDLKRTVEKISELDFLKMDEFVGDLRTWLSAAVTNQETCVDAFENTTGDTGERMRELLKIARELASNGLAMITDLSAVLGSFNLGSFGLFGGSRRLLSEEEEARVDRRLAEANRVSMKPTIVVAKDGSGQFATINEAVAAVKNDSQNFTVILVKGGVYRESVSIPMEKKKVVMIGEGPNVTRITGNKSIVAGVPTFFTATVDVNSEDFLAKDMGIENYAGPEGHQAVALRVSGDRAIFYNVSVSGYQGSLCADAYRQYYRNCTITGTIDFLFGDALALFQNCTFLTRKPGPNQEYCVVVAHGRNDSNSNTAFVIHNSHIMAKPALLHANPPIPSYLARPWKPYSRTIIMHTQIDTFIDPTGWIAQIGHNTCYLGEYDNFGPGSNMQNRVTWPGIRKITSEIARTWTGSIMYANDAWIAESGVPYDPSLKEA